MRKQKIKFTVTAAPSKGASDHVRDVCDRGRFTLSQIAGACGISVGDQVRYKRVVDAVKSIEHYRPRNTPVPAAS